MEHKDGTFKNYNKTGPRLGGNCSFSHKSSPCFTTTLRPTAMDHNERYCSVRKVRSDLSVSYIYLVQDEDTSESGPRKRIYEEFHSNTARKRIAPNGSSFQWDNSEDTTNYSLWAHSAPSSSLSSKKCRES